MADVIDAHHHLWHYRPEEYPWIQSDMRLLQRDFLAGELAGEMQRVGITGSIAVQARQSLAETEWLIQCAERYAQIAGVVGWAPLQEPDIQQQLGTLTQHPMLRGLRHVIQDEAADDFLLDEQFNRGIRAMQGSTLVYDLLIRASQLPATIKFVESHLNQSFVLDHLAKPSIKTGSTELWQRDLKQLATFPNVTCKLSGLVTEADWSNWSETDILPYLDIALDAFGPKRLLAGSDWPVCLVASSYERWWSVLFDWTASLPQPERHAILGGTAIRIYGLASS